MGAAGSGTFFGQAASTTFVYPPAQLNQPVNGTSQDVAKLLSQGEQAEASGKNAEALAAYKAAARIAPSDAQLYLKIGLIEGKAGDFENAKRAFQRALELQPDLAESRYNLGLAIIGESKQVPAWKEALREFEAALVSRPGYPDALNMSGVCMLESGDTAEATKRFRAAIQREPDSARIHFNLGRALEATGHAREAFEEYVIAAKKQSPYPEAEIAIGNLLLKERDYQLAAEHLRSALAANPDLREAHYSLAQALRHSGETGESRIELKQAAALIQAQSNAVMSSHLSNESLDKAKTGDIPGAIQLAKKALWLDPENAIADYNLGLLLADAGNFEASIFQLRKAISLAPLESSFYVSLAKVEEHAKNPGAAQEALARAMQLDPDSADLHKTWEEFGASTASIQLAMPRAEIPLEFPFGAPADTADGHFAFATQLSKEGDLLGAVGELLRATTMRPESSNIRYNLAVARAQLGQPDQAELDFRNVLIQSPSNVDAHMGLGSLLFEAKNYEAAASEFSRVLELQPANQEAARLLEKCPKASNQ